MCYLVAKKFDQQGSLVLEAEQGQRLASLSKYLTLTTLEHGVQIVTLKVQNKELKPIIEKMVNRKHSQETDSSYGK